MPPSLYETPLADLLERKIVRKYADFNLTEDLYRLVEADMRVVHQMVLEHVEAYRD